MDYTDVIIIKGPVETLSFFSERLAETFYTELNKNVIAWDMKKPLESRHFIENIREKAVLITFNFIGLSGESQIIMVLKKSASWLTILFITGTSWK